jgi:ubiquinone/menaquinone biosynthesis C-methylase UbiE
MSETQNDPAIAAAKNYEKIVVTYTTAPFAAILLEQADPQPGEHVVDVACGTGIVARQAAPRVGANGEVVAVDINPAMLTVGRSLPAPQGAAIDWREGSALALPLPDSAYDLVLCQAGLMFFPDRSAALREMVRVLKPGGRVAVNVWRSPEHNPVSQLIWGTLARHLNTTISAINSAMSLGDAGELHALLETAGFSGVTVVARSYTVREPYTPRLMARILTAVSWLPAIAAMTSEERDALADAIQDEIDPVLANYVEGDEQLYPMSAHIALARKP